MTESGRPPATTSAATEVYALGSSQGESARLQMYPPGNSRRTIRLDLVRTMRPQVLEMGLASEAELDELDAAARAHLDDSRTIAVSALFYLAWGRKPVNE